MDNPALDGPFGGENAEAQNALRAAFKHAANVFGGYDGEYADYEFLQKTPRTSLVVFTIEALDELGYEIRKKDYGGGD